MEKAIDISVVIPAYNEESCIGSTVKKIADYLSRGGKSFEIVVIDDGSADSTGSVLEKLLPAVSNLKLLCNEKNEGKGDSVRKGMMNAGGKLIYFTDADLSTPVEEIERFAREIESCDVVIGSRSMDGANIVVHEPFYREILGKTFNKMVRLWCLPGFIDTQCGAKMFRNAAAKRIFSLLKVARFAFDVEALYIAKKLGYTIKEIPITWSHSTRSSVRTFLDGPKMLLDLLCIRWAHRGIR